MAERADEPERWTIGRRAGRVAAVGALAIPALLLGSVVLAGWFYDRDIRPKTHQHVTPFPAPGIETFIHAGALDPHEAAPSVRVDPRVAAAKQAVVHDGLPGWPTR